MIKDLEKNYKKYLENSRKQTKYIKDNFTMKHMTDKFIEIIDKNVKVPQAVALNLPKLKKVGSTNLGQLKLPKLKKV